MKSTHYFTALFVLLFAYGCGNQGSNQGELFAAGPANDDSAWESTKTRWSRRSPWKCPRDGPSRAECFGWAIRITV